MWGRRSGDRHAERRAGQLFEQAQRLLTLGRLPESLVLQEEALGVLQALGDARPDDLRVTRSLAVLLSLMGSTLNALGRPDDALRALDACEDAYLDLIAAAAGRREARDVGPDLAVVRTRRALAQLRRGYGASAMIDLDLVVAAYTRLGAWKAGHRHYHALARALSANATVLWHHGDPDLAVASAARSLDMFRPVAARRGRGQEGLADAAAGYSAALVAATIHDAQGGPDRATAYRQLATYLADVMGMGPGAPVEAPRAGGGDASDTVAGALAVAADRLGAGRVSDLARAVLFDPTGPGCPVIVSERCPPHLALATARELGALAIDLLPAVAPAGLRLGLEAHCLLATTSRSEDPAIRNEVGQHAVFWAQLRSACSDAYAVSGSEAMARDVTGWIA